MYASTEKSETCNEKLGRIILAIRIEYEDLISKVNLFLSEEQITIHLFPK